MLRRERERAGPVRPSLAGPDACSPVGTPLPPPAILCFNFTISEQTIPLEEQLSWQFVSFFLEFAKNKQTAQIWNIFLAYLPGHTRSEHSTSPRKEIRGPGSTFAPARKTCLQIDILKHNKHINNHLVCLSIIPPAPMTCAENSGREI